MPNWADENGRYWWNPPGRSAYESVEIPHAPVGDHLGCGCAMCTYKEADMGGLEPDEECGCGYAGGCFCDEFGTNFSDCGTGWSEAMPGQETWRTRDGQTMKVCDMDNRHLMNTFRMLGDGAGLSGTALRKWRAIRAELRSRQLIPPAPPPIEVLVGIGKGDRVNTVNQAINAIEKGGGLVTAGGYIAPEVASRLSLNALKKLIEAECWGATKIDIFATIAELRKVKEVP